MPTINKRNLRRITTRWHQWNDEVRKTRALIRQFKRTAAQGGQKWKDAMVRHYTARLDELETAEPEKYMAS